MLRGAGSVSLAFLCLLCAASSAGSGISGEGSGDAHTYHADGRVVRNKVAHTHDDLALTSDRLSAAAFMMLADGLNGEAARTFAASARVTRNASPGCPAAFAAPSGVWVASHGGHYRPVCRRPRRAGNFFDGVSSMGEAVERYTKFHSEEMARGRIKADGRYVMYRPSFHGEGWGNRMMALVAVTALGMGTGTYPRLFIANCFSLTSGRRGRLLPVHQRSSSVSAWFGFTIFVKTGSFPRQS